MSRIPSDLKPATFLIHAGRDPEQSFGYVNFPPVEGSTILHKDMADMQDRNRRSAQGDHSAKTYGTHGGPTHDAFFKAMNELEGGAGTWAYSTGLAGCLIPFFAFVKAGDHVLVTDSVYGPTREFCETVLTNFGVQTEFYEPTIGADIEKLIRPNTRVIFMESPGSHTFEMQDVPAIAAVAQRKNVITMIDNTYATPLNFQPLKHGVDVVIHAATKYICGHSDVLMSTVTCNEKTWEAVYRISNILGQYAPAQSIYMAARGLHTLKVRLDAVGAHTKAVVDFLDGRPEVERILWPAHEKDPGYPIYKRDFAGSVGLFGILFSKKYSSEDIDRFADALKLFGYGYSWGGFESLMIRSYADRNHPKPDLSRMVRCYIGLEDPQDMIEDIRQALDVMNRAKGK